MNKIPAARDYLQEALGLRARTPKPLSGDLLLSELGNPDCEFDHYSVHSDENE